MHFLSLRHLKDKRGQKEDQQAQQIPWGSQTFPWKLQSPCSWPEPLCGPSVLVWLQNKSEGRGMLSERSHRDQRDPVPVATRMGSFWCCTLHGGRQKAQVTADNHQKTTQKAPKRMNQRPVYNALPFLSLLPKCSSSHASWAPARGPENIGQAFAIPWLGCWWKGTWRKEHAFLSVLLASNIWPSVPATLQQKWAFAGTAAVAEGWGKTRDVFILLLWKPTTKMKLFFHFK